jgi:ABC-type molybdate transport system substrate-binding protein
MHDSESMLRRCLLDAPLARGMTAAFVAVLFLGPVVMSNAANADTVQLFAAGSLKAA